MTSKVAVAHKYDAEGRLFERSVLSRDPSSGNMEYVYFDQISHDARGKVRSVSIQSDISSISQDFWINAYDGNGALAGTARSRGGGITADVFITDALGNTLARIGNTGTTPDTVDYRYAGDQLMSMHRHRRALVSDGGAVDSTRYDKELGYDLNGNQFFQQHWTWQYTEAVNDSSWPSNGRKEQSWSWMTHGVDNKLRVAQRSWYDTTGHRTVFSEYQYDTLGRRLAVRTRRDSLCTATSTYRCLATTERFIWDGDQLVAELRSPASTPDGQGGGSANFFGRVRYTHAGGIDEPIAVWEGGDAIVPHLSWRGQFEAGSDLISGDLLEGSGWVWPARYRDVNLAPELRTPIPDPTRWLGSLIEGQVDLNGLAYRRNRYYNPQTGRFTQEDPIGLAGGVNLYGFADGDPVNLSDPFGLCSQPLAQGLASLRCALEDVLDAIKAGPRLLARALARSGHKDFVLGLAGLPIGVVGGGSERALFQGGKAALRQVLKTGSIDGVSGAQGLSLLARLKKGRVDNVAITAGENGSIRAAFTRVIDDITEVTTRTYDRAGQQVKVWIRRFNKEGKEVY